ncbi:MAG: hypothetical protein GF411_04030 [Candidatus Lokiarchaeota archaeon]|nr:hypothetical protein [Candidatus Lokiarchaeota archaeon]
MTRTTTIRCKLCEDEISFDINDSSTYQTKTESGNPLIGILYTVRVQHQYKEGVSHINVVVVDERGEYRAHKDCYEEEKVGDAFSQYETIARQFPIEIRHFLPLANPEEKWAISQMSQPLSCKANDWTETLEELEKKHPDSKLFSFLTAKWAVVTGNTTKVLKNPVEKISWIYPLQVRLKGRKNLTDEVLEITKELDKIPYPELIKLEAAIAQGENFIRSISTEEMDALVQRLNDEWGNDSRVGVKTAIAFVQGMYWYLKFRVGTTEDIIKRLETAFNFCQIVENREAMSMIGNLFASVLRNQGEVKKALRTYQLVLDVCSELGNQRCMIVVSINTATLQLNQGLFKEAHERLRWVLDHPIAQADQYLRVTTMGNLSESLFKLGRFDESRELCKQLIAEENIPIDIYMAVLARLTGIAAETNSLDDLDWIKENIPEHEYMESPRGKAFLLNLKAIEAEVKNDWLKMVKFLKEQRNILDESGFMELLNESEFRIAEGYAMLYQQTKDSNYLQEAFKHLDLAKTLSHEARYYPDIVRLTMLKGIVAATANLFERARDHFQDALVIAQEHQFDELIDEISVYLESIESEDTALSQTQDLRSHFEELTIRFTEAVDKKEPGKALAIWLENDAVKFDTILFNSELEKENHAMYLRGVVDLWKSLSMKIDTPIFESFEGECGHIIQESTNNFTAVVISDRSDYIIQRNLQDIMKQLEEFPLKQVPEELSAKFLSLVESKFGEFETLNIEKTD